MAERERLVELIEKLKASDKNVVRASVVEDLGNLRDRRAIGPLIEALNDEEMLVRWNAIKALAMLGDEAALPLLKALNEPDKFKRRNIVQALGELGGDEVTSHLIRMLMFDESEQVVLIEVVRALDRLRDSRSVEPLITVLKMNDWELRFRAVHALAHLADAQAIEPLLEVMNDPDKDIKWAAYMAIESIKANAKPAEELTDGAPAAAKPAKPAGAELNLYADAKQDRVVIGVDGDLYSTNIDNFSGFVSGVLAVYKNNIEIDMTKCSFMDSFALSRLNTLRKTLKSKNRALSLTGLKPNVKAVFTATKLDQLFNIT